MEFTRHQLLIIACLNTLHEQNGCTSVRLLDMLSNIPQVDMLDALNAIDECSGLEMDRFQVIVSWPGRDQMVAYGVSQAWAFHAV